MQCAHATTILGATPSSDGGALLTDMSTFDIQEGFGKLYMGLSPSPAYHVAAMTAFRYKAGIGPQPYTKAAGLITVVGDK